MPRRRFVIIASAEPSGESSSLPQPGGLAPGSIVNLLSEENHHLKNVLRLRKGALFEGIDRKSGGAFLCEVASTQGDTVTATIVNPLEAKSLSRLALLLGAPKPGTLDFAVEKAVELGASELHIFGAERSQADKRWLEARNERLDRVICSAGKQCRCSFLPSLTLHDDLAAALPGIHGKEREADVKENRFAFCTSAEINGELPVNLIHDAFTANTSPGLSGPAPVLLEKKAATADFYVLIGPEGGLTEAEMHYAAEFGYRAATLGPNVLRTETAVILALGLIRLLQTS